jgi:hypothetical protein
MLWSSGLRRPEDGGNIFIRNADNRLQGNKILQPIILKYEFSDRVFGLGSDLPRAHKRQLWTG